MSLQVSNALLKIIPFLYKPALSALSALCLGAVFQNAESKKIKQSSLEIPDIDKKKSHETFVRIGKYFDDQKEDNIYDFKELNINPVDLLKQLGDPYKNIPDTNVFKNSPLIEYAVFHDLDLYKVLDYCDFKSNPQITKNALTYKDTNGLNFINHAMRNRVALGDKLTAKIVDIYVDNLDKETLHESLDKFVLTLPPEQFKKIVDKVGVENLQKIIGKKNLKEKIIHQEISKYHSPDIFPCSYSYFHLDLDGYDKSTVNSKASDVSEILSFVEAGKSVQISQKMMSEIAKNPVIQEKLTSNSNRDKIFITTAPCYSGTLATRKTFESIEGEDKIIFKEQFDTSKTAIEDFLENLKVNKKYLAQQKTSFSASRAGDNPSTEPSSPQDLLQRSQREL